MKKFWNEYTTALGIIAEGLPVFFAILTTMLVVIASVVGILVLIVSLTS